MSLLEKLEGTAKSLTKDHPDIDYLRNSELGSVVNRGLAELYKVQPKNPITFLANWLLNESRSKEIKKKIDGSNILKTMLKAKYDEERKVLDHQRLLKDQELRKEIQKKEDFFNKIRTSNDIEIILNSVCQELKNLVNATGVYMSIYDRKRKLKITDEDDETAHLLDDKVIRYINFDDEHAFLKNKYLEPGTGVTYDLYVPKENTEQAVDDGNAGDGSNGEAQTKKLEEALPNYKLVEEVVRNPNMKFFREPRLGCYLAVDMAYKSSLFTNALLSAITNLNEYNQNLAKQEERRKEYNERLAEIQKEREKAALDGSGEPNLENQENIEGFVEEKVELQDFEKEDKKMILQLDTLGQDRKFNDEEMKFIFTTMKVLKESWEKLEYNLLIKDRDLKIEFDEIDRYLKETYTQEKIEGDEEKFIKEYLTSEKFVENPIPDDRVRAIESDYGRSRFIINSFFDDENIHKLFLMFAKFEFVEFEKLFQNTLYFIGVSNLDINEENTNKLEWKKARKYWNVSVLEKLKSYNPFGPKVGKLPTFSMGNRLIANFDNLNSRREELRNYSFVLVRLLDFLQTILKVRKEDILRRKDYFTELAEKRKKAEADYEERNQLREKELDDARRAAVDEENNPVEFNEEEFLKNWDDAHPPIEIPNEVVFDVDDDIDLDKLS